MLPVFLLLWKRKNSGEEGIIQRDWVGDDPFKATHSLGGDQTSSHTRNMPLWEGVPHGDIITENKEIWDLRWT